LKQATGDERGLSEAIWWTAGFAVQVSQRNGGIEIDVPRLGSMAAMRKNAPAARRFTPDEAASESGLRTYDPRGGTTQRCSVVMSRRFCIGFGMDNDR
jgi:hypothetical protein